MTHVTRRAFLLTSAMGVALLAAGPSAWAQGDQSAAATRFIQNFGNQLVAIVDAPAGNGTKEQQMRPLIEQAVAVDQIGQFVLGRYWRIATPAQQQRFLQLFHAVLINNIGSKLGEFRGVGFRLTQTMQREGEYFVGTLISRPNQQPSNVQWVVSMASGKPEIIDVVAEGTSLRLTQRSDYASYISRNGSSVDALLAALQRQTSA